MDSSNLLQQMIARSNQVKNSNNGPNRTNTNNHTLTSLLSDDQKMPRTGTSAAIAQSPSNQNRAHHQTVLKRQSLPGDDTNTVQSNARSKEAYLAYLQERAAKAGISIGEINKTSATQIGASSGSSKSFDNPASGPVRDSSGQISDKKSNEARNDLSLLYPPISLATSSQRQVNFLAAGLDTNEGLDITEEVKKIIQEECNIIYECKGCSNLFRSLANLVKHKRQFCDNSNIERAHAEMSKQFLMNVPTSEAPASITSSNIESSSNRPGLTVDSRDVPIDARRSEHLNASVSIGSQKYNLRGRRIDSAPEIVGELKSTRITRSHDRKDNREQGSSGELNLSTNSCLHPQQTNLSRLLQSQPKNRQTSTKDSALMDALNTPNPANNRRSIMGSSSPRTCSINELDEQLVKNSSLAKTLLNENAKSVNSSSSPAQLTRPVTQKSKAVPKRKLLEDCIQKVKRDKLPLGEDGDQDDSRVVSGAVDHSSQTNQPMDDINQYKDPLAIDDSGTDSDALVMDLDEPSCAPKSRRKAPLGLKSEEDRLHESSLSNKLNTSSALLKALTRPVETKPAYVGNSRVADDKVSVGSVSSTEAQEASSVVAEVGDEARSTGTREGSIDNSTIADDSGSRDTETEDLEVIPPSPLFDKYTCEMCDTDLVDQSQLLTHTIEYHRKEKKIYPCLFCSFTFITLENVCRHIIDMHKKTKTQVGHLKEVVRSRSFISQDFKACSDCPAIIPPDSQGANERSDVGQLETITVKPDSVDTRRSSSALSDSAATKQILEDTLALVSNTSSPETTTSASSDRLASILSRARLAGRRVTSLPRGANENKASEQGAANDDGDDPLCDSLLTNLTEHLAILESQEAEIEAEKLRRAQSSTVQDKACRQIADQEDLVAPKAEPAEDAREVIASARDEEASEASVEFINQQTTPSRGKHIVAGQPFDEVEPQNSDQDEDGDEDDFEPESQDAANIGEYEETMNEVEESQDDGSDESTFGQDPDRSDNDRSEPDSAESCQSNSGSNDNDEQDYEERDDEYNNDSDFRSARAAASKREHKKRRFSRDGDGEAKTEEDEEDTDLKPSHASDKTAAQNFHEIALTKESSSHSLKAASKASLMEGGGGGGGYKLKVKSSMLRDAGASGSAAGSSSSSAGAGTGAGATGSAESSGGGIKKLKIQLKAQPDEKSKVYRIVN